MIKFKKTLLLSILVISPIMANVEAKSVHTCNTSTCEVGDTGPGGGTVFYKAHTKQIWGQYMEFAPVTWYGGSTDPEVVWCSNTSTIISSPLDGTSTITSTGTAIGTGWTNTQIMMNVGCTWGTANIARNYLGGGKSDWFLPSKDELNTMYKFFTNTGRGGFSTYDYWSSSENAPDGAWLQSFSNDDEFGYYKSAALLVRPIRAF